MVHTQGENIEDAIFQKDGVIRIFWRLKMPLMGESKYKHVIWDWNGTLLDDVGLCVDVMNGVLRRRNMPALTHKRYQEVFDFPVVDYYRRLGFDFEKEPFEVSGTEFIVEYEKRRHEAQLQPYAERTLKTVEKLGVTQSLLSAYKQETLEELTHYLGVRDFFIGVVGLDDHYAYGKIDLAKRWMEELRHRPHEVLFVGDTVHDHEVAREIGADCVLIASGHHTGRKLEGCGVPVLESLPNVVTYLKDKN